MTSQYTDSTAYLQSLATAAKLSVENTSNRIYGLAEPDGDRARLKETGFSHTVTKPALEAPPRLSDLLDVTDTSDAWKLKLDTDAAAWINRYFPSLGQCLQTLPEEWLCGVIAGTKPFGLDATVFELVWQRARDRAYRTLASEQRQIEATFAGRGFSLPPGAMVAQVAAATERASDAAAQVNIEQAIKDAEIRLELLKFAEEQALNHKRGILQALADFMRQWIQLPNNDIERARIKAQAMSSLYSALSSHYNVELAFEELKLKVAQLKAETDNAIDRNRIANREADDDTGKAAALGQVARAFADIASQAAQSAGTLVAQIENV